MVDQTLAPFRMLDYDDLIILSLINENYSQVYIARHLNIGASALCHRVKKYNDIWNGITYKKNHRVVISKKYKRLVNNIRIAALTLIDAPTHMRYSKVIEGIDPDKKDKAYTTKEYNCVKNTNPTRGRYANELI